MLRARDIMSTQVQTVAARMPVLDFAQLLSTRHISGVPVVSDDGALIGMATGMDLLSKTGATVGEIMTRRVTSVTEDTPVPEIAHMLVRLKIHRVPVLRGTALLGIVSQSDIVRAIARADHPEMLLGNKAQNLSSA
jgi:CBS domain-containing protein